MDKTLNSITEEVVRSNRPKVIEYLEATAITNKPIFNWFVEQIQAVAGKDRKRLHIVLNLNRILNEPQYLFEPKNTKRSPNYKH